MDVADAINIMLYASPRPSTATPDSGATHDAEHGHSSQHQTPTQAQAQTQTQQPGCAVWDLFRAEDADKIRLFLKRKFGTQVHFVDPIHSQVFYLDAALRKELADKYGVVSWRVYQYPVSVTLSEPTQRGSPVQTYRAGTRH
jgi:hypothetical protein